MNIIITGASRGLGASLAFRFARYSSNHIHLLSRNHEALGRLKDSIKEQHPDANIYNYAADLNSAEDISSFIDQIGKERGCVDILINNAGSLIRKEFTAQSPVDILKLLAVNYIGPSLLIHGLMPLLLSSKKAHVVNIGSMGGVQGSVKFPGLSHYSASKGALAVLTECLAEEYKDTTLSFNYIALGAVQTEMLSEAFPGYKAAVTANEAAVFIEDFALNGHRYMNGKIIPFSRTTP